MSSFYYPNNEILTPRWATGVLPKPWWKRLIALWIALAVLALIALALLAWWFLTLPERNARAATVLVLVDADGDRNFDSQGSGAFINARGFVLTARHVVVPNANQKPARIVVWYKSGSGEKQEMEATLERVGEGALDTSTENIRNDWAVLRVTTKERLPVIPLADKTDFNEEERMKALGFPRMQETTINQKTGPAVKIVEGTINRVDRTAQGGVVRLTHSASTAEGMSGGPVVQNGKLIGLNTAVLGGGSVTANENYSLPAYLLRESVFKQYGEK